MKRVSLLILPLLSLVFFCRASKYSAIQGESIVVIINKDNPIEKLTVSEAKLYFTRKIKKRWPNFEKNIRPATRKNKCFERDAFYRNVLSMTDEGVEEYFTNKQLQNAERPPDKFTSETDMVNFVAEEPGAIGFIKASSWNDELKSKVKAVLSL
jgi:ABC-type phosphate transport system substrate-binding protein